MPKLVKNGLTALRVKTAGTGVYSDGNGLTLRVSDSGGRSWVQRVRIDGKQRNIGLGSYPAVSLMEARGRAIYNLREVEDGRNPIEERRQAKEAAKQEAPIIEVPTVPTFQDAATVVIDLRRPTWSSERHARQWIESLTNHVFPTIGHRPVDTVTTSDVLKILTPIWTAKAETATRVKQRMEVVFDWAIVAGYRADNPASPVKRALPRRPRVKAHHPALHYSKVAAALASVKESASAPVTKLAFEFLVLTAVRTGEVRGATWAEIDVEARTWTHTGGENESAAGTPDTLV